MLPPAPGLYSTTSWMPADCNCSDSRFAIVELVPPGGYGTTRRTSFDGNSSAALARAARAASGAASSARRSRKVSRVMAMSPAVCGSEAGLCLHLRDAVEPGGVERACPRGGDRVVELLQ